LIAPFYQEIRRNNFTATYRERPLGGEVIYCPSEVGLQGLDHVNAMTEENRREAAYRLCGADLTGFDNE
jgi:hypothetical protein